MRLIGRMATTALAAGLTACLLPSVAWADETRDSQWMLDALDIEKVHEVTKGAGTRIGLIDSGVEAGHPDLKGNVEEGLTTWESGDGQKDTLGHGTAMASLLVGHGHGEDNKDGILGIAPEAKIVPVSVYPKEYAEDPDSIATGQEFFKGFSKGLRWLADEAKVDVIVMPLGYGFSERANDAVKYVAGKDIPMFAPTGNNQGTNEIGDDPSVQAPGILDGVEAVAGTGQDNKQWDGSNYGPETIFSAPAADIITADRGGKYATASGTSNASAIAGGIAALLDSQWPDMDRGIIQWRLAKTATDVDDPGSDSRTGYGVLNPYEALTATVDIPDKLQDGDKAEDYNPEPNPRPSESAKDNALKPGGGGVPAMVWWIVGGAAVLVAAAVIVVLVKRKKTPPSPPPTFTA